MARKGIGYYSLLTDMGLDTAEDRLGSIEMWTVWREEEKGVATSSDGVLDPLGLVKFRVVHEKNVASAIKTREELIFQKFGKGLLIVSTSLEDVC